MNSPKVESLGDCEQLDKLWCERGEFPPAGAEVEVKSSGYWHKTTVIGMNGPYCVYVSAGFEKTNYNGDDDPKAFRQIKSDCQKFIESAIDAAVIDNGIPVAVVPYLNEVFERMFHAGFKSPDKLIGDLESAKNAAYMALKDIDCREWRDAVQALVNADLLKFKE